MTLWQLIGSALFILLAFVPSAPPAWLHKAAGNPLSLFGIMSVGISAAILVGSSMSPSSRRAPLLFRIPGTYESHGAIGLLLFMTGLAIVAIALLASLRRRGDSTPQRRHWLTAGCLGAAVGFDLALAVSP